VSKQKFKRGSRVKILNADYRQPIRALPHGEVIATLRSHRANYGGDEGIVVGSYRQQFGHGETSSYTLTVLDSTGSPVNRVSWFDEKNLELVSSDYMAGHDLIDAL
jgi:hypothetical protein